MKSLAVKHGTSALAIALAVGSAQATIETQWLNGQADNSFTNALNWDAGVGPLAYPTNETWIGVINKTGTDYSEFNSPGVEAYVRQLKIGISGATGEFRLTDGILNMHDTVLGGLSFTELRIGQSGGNGTFIQSGGTNKANYLRCPLDNTSVGAYIMSGGQLEVYNGGGNHDSSLVIGANGNNTAMRGTFEISGGSISNMIRGVELGNDDGSIGTFHVVGSGPDRIILGDNQYASNGYGAWFQYPDSVLKVGIDGGGVTPIQLVDANGAGQNDVTFEAGALLEPYFVGGAQTGKWSVIEADEFTDWGIAFSTNVTDTNWSFTITNSTLEVWYGFGDSGYVTTNIPPVIVYTNATIYWDGEAGDGAFDNPTNWAMDITGTLNPNNALPEVGTAGAILEFVNIGLNQHCVYTDVEGSRTYEEINIGRGGGNIGRLDLVGTGYTLKADKSSSHYIGVGGGTGIVNITGGATLFLNGSPGRIGRDGGSIGMVTLTNTNSRIIYGRESGGISVEIGADGGTGIVNVRRGGKFRTRAGVELGHEAGTGLFSVEGLFTEVAIGTEGSLDGLWLQNNGSTLQALVTAEGLNTIQIVNKDAAAGGNDGNVSFLNGSLLDVGFSGFDGVNGSWDLMHWDGALLNSNLAFSGSVDTNIWSFAFVDTDATNGVDTLRISATGFGPTVQPDITGFSVSGPAVSLTWNSEVGASYNVLSKAALTDATWSTKAAAIPGAGATTTTNLTGSGAAEFYRIEAY